MPAGTDVALRVRGEFGRGRAGPPDAEGTAGWRSCKILLELMFQQDLS
jgi:hypothetical protein